MGDNNQESTPKTKLSSEDINAILDAFEERFYNRIGKSFWEVIKYGLVVVAIAIAAFGFQHRG